MCIRDRDEADRMLDMGFVHDVKKVIAKLPKVRQNLMFLSLIHISCERERCMDEALIREQEQQLQRTGKYYKHICWMAVPPL